MVRSFTPLVTHTNDQRVQIPHPASTSQKGLHCSKEVKYRGEKKEKEEKKKTQSIILCSKDFWLDTSNLHAKSH